MNLQQWIDYAPEYEVFYLKTASYQYIRYRTFKPIQFPTNKNQILKRADKCIMVHTVKRLTYVLI